MGNCSGAATVIELSSHNESRCDRCWDRCSAGFDPDSSFRIRGPGTVVAAMNCIGKINYSDAEFLDDLKTDTMGCQKFVHRSAFVLCSFHASVEGHHKDRFAALCEKGVHSRHQKQLKKANKKMHQANEKLLHAEKQLQQANEKNSCTELQLQQANEKILRTEELLRQESEKNMHTEQRLQQVLDGHSKSTEEAVEMDGSIEETWEIPGR